jgi:hypothetical protein
LQHPFPDSACFFEFSCGIAILCLRFLCRVPLLPLDPITTRQTFPYSTRPASDISFAVRVQLFRIAAVSVAVGYLILDFPAQSSQFDELPSSGGASHL